ncbi:MAG: hypothetical protein H6672_09490 [Anaerolineaceae bacterium]|nr:hypothetical protein [Anaerolineaceae bacterium]
MISSTIEAVTRLQVIQTLCLSLSSRLEEDAGMLTIPRNYEYEGQLNGFQEIAADITESVTQMSVAPSDEMVRTAIQELVHKIEWREILSRQDALKHEKYKRDYRGMMLYYRPLGTECACKKVMTWLNDAIQVLKIPVEHLETDD